MRNRSKDGQEQNAIEYHATYYGVHRFYIRAFEEYILMEPFIKMFPNVKLIIARKIRDDFNRMVDEHEGKDTTKKYDRERYMRTKRKDVYMC